MVPAVLISTSARPGFAQYVAAGTGVPGGTAMEAARRTRSEGQMGSGKRKQLEQALEFEQTQLAILERQAARRPPTDPVQIANWPALIESHRKAIAFYKARLGDLQNEDG